MKKLLSLLGAAAVLSAAAFAQNYEVERIWEKHPGDYTQFLVTSHMERGLAYNPITDHLLIPSRNNNSVHIIKAADAEYVTQLDMTGVEGGTFHINKIQITEDGAIYVGNLSTDTTGGTDFNLYRWENEEAEPVRVYSGDPGGGDPENKRWGDSLIIRGTGEETMVLLGDYTGTTLSLLQPDPNDLMGPDSFTATQIYTDISPNTARNLAFGPGSIVYLTTASATEGSGHLFELEIDFEFHYVMNQRQFGGAIIARGLGALGYGEDEDVLVGLRPLSHGISVYKRTHLTDQWTVNPVATFEFAPGQPDDQFVRNDNATGEVLVVGDIIYALDTNNSLAALRLIASEEGGAFADWIADQNVPEDQQGAEDDPDGDGISNLMEYALGGDPSVPDRSILPVIGFENVDETQYLSIAYSKREDAEGIDYIVEVSSDLANWESGESATTIVSEDEAAAIVRDNVPMTDSNRRFIRLRVEEQ